ncbi:phage protein [Xanthomonas campestris pv. zinniae]|nr:phage protein [Xanthomonas campestris pv. zinniae]
MVVPPQEADRTMQLDTYERVDLTGPWAGFGFQGHRFFTPEGRDIDPVGMRYWSLTCNIAREWALMMAEEREQRSIGASNKTKNSGRPNLGPNDRSKNVIYLRDVFQRRREKRSSVVADAGSADRAQVVRRTRGPRGPRRG